MFHRTVRHCGGTLCTLKHGSVLYLGLHKSVWSLDDLLIGGMAATQESVYETFDAEPHSETWTFWSGGRIDRFCDLNTRFVQYAAVMNEQCDHSV